MVEILLLMSNQSSSFKPVIPPNVPLTPQMSETKEVVDQFPRLRPQTRHSLSAGLLLLTNLAEDTSHVHATEQPPEERKKLILSSVVAQGLHSFSVEGRSWV